MAIKVSGTTVIDDSRNIQNIGIVTATSFVGDGSQLTGVGGIGQPTGDTDGLFNYVSVASTITQSITFDTSNAGTDNSSVVSIVPTLTVASGVGVTVETGKTMVIDVLNIGGL